MDAEARLRALGFSAGDAATLADHFLDAERRGKRSHGLSRIDWLATQELDPGATPEPAFARDGFEYWESNGAVGYLVLARICERLAEEEPSPAKLVAADAFPTGMLGYWVRRLAEAGLVAALTATSPARLAHPSGGPPLVGTNPLAIGLPNPEGEPIVVDVSMGRVTYGDVLRGDAAPEDLVPFGGEQAHKAFALALGLEGLVSSFVGERHGILLLAAKPEFDGFAAKFRERAGGIRIPGDS